MIAPRRWLGVAPNTLAQLPLALCLAAVDRRPPPEGTPRGRRCVLATVRGLEAPLPVRRGTTACLLRRGTVAAYGIFPGTVHQSPRRQASVGLGGIHAAVADTLVVWRTAQVGEKGIYPPEREEEEAGPRARGIPN
jgi:hypothetical protein